METIQAEITHRDWVQAYYAELMITKAAGANPTVNELIAVSNQAAETYAEGDSSQIIARLTGNHRHPYGAMWTAGELDGRVYFEWTYAIGRLKAAENRPLKP